MCIADILLALVLVLVLALVLGFKGAVYFRFGVHTHHRLRMRPPFDVTCVLLNRHPLHEERNSTFLTPFWGGAR